MWRLIEGSSTEVRQGLSRIGDASSSLQSVVQGVREIAGQMRSMSTSSARQRDSLQEISQAVNELDHRRIALRQLVELESVQAPACRSTHGNHVEGSEHPQRKAKTRRDRQDGRSESGCASGGQESRRTRPGQGAWRGKMYQVLAPVATPQHLSMDDIERAVEMMVAAR